MGKYILTNSRRHLEKHVCAPSLPHRKLLAFLCHCWYLSPLKWDIALLSFSSQTTTLAFSSGDSLFYYALFSPFFLDFLTKFPLYWEHTGFLWNTLSHTWPIELTQRMVVCLGLIWSFALKSASCPSVIWKEQDRWYYLGEGFMSPASHWQWLYPTERHFWIYLYFLRYEWTQTS